MMKLLSIFILFLSSITAARAARAYAAFPAAGAENYDSIYYKSTCAGQNIIFGSTVFDSLPFDQLIVWNFGDPTSGIYNQAGVQSPTHVFALPGTYYISLIVVNAGTTDTVLLRDTITVTTPLTYNFGPDIYLCQGQDTLLQAPVIPGARYDWNNGPPDTTTDTLRVIKSGVYTVSINGCGVSDSIGVFISTLPNIRLGGNHVMCDSANLELDATTQNGQYTWNLNGTVLPYTGGQLETYNPGGTYIVSVYVPGCGTYGDTAAITYSGPQKPAFNLGPDTLLCPKEIDTLNASIPGATAFAWNTGSGDSLIYITQPGTYWVFVTYQGQCQVTDSVLVTYMQTQNLDFNDTAICQGGFLELDADFGQGTYNWTAIPAQRNDQNGTGQATYYVYNPGTYAVVASVGQCLYKDTITVTFDDSLRVYLPKDTSACNGAEFSLDVTGNPDSVTWQDGAQGPRYPVPQPGGAYTAIAKNGCGSDTLTSVVIFGECACSLIMPTAFTPNGDGHNDLLLPLNYCRMSAYQMQIYNRYGALVFESESPETGWDGTFKGKAAFTGNYVWMIRYGDPGTGKMTVRKGNVVLIR
jgi:gliding motility-associated-like protein